LKAGHVTNAMSPLGLGLLKVIENVAVRWTIYCDFLLVGHCENSSVL